ncbi:hypothetical protein M011DRAFT_464809 [Sporormia fimetaria CBS 119925]|uniref:Uncharacterized protein n=1 Tax=Sporormia fimetaria CBS 119925 TaxID=1340428 RepID=A0A6A6VPA8_9PLEO|nr:hypothetical protein M011DRAFT_464809 [Sporormia fimetaria CBS 119925]
MEASRRHDRDQQRARGLRPNMFEPREPARVSTDPQPSSKKSHLHGLPHHHRHHRHHSRHAKDVVQSAVQLHPPTSFGDLLKQVSRGKNSSPERNRRGSLGKDEPEEKEASALPQKVVRPEEVTKERTKIQAAEEALRSSLHSLWEQSLKTSRQLDDTYYSLLEKLPPLRQTIASLQELLVLTRELQDDFSNDTKELAEDIQGQVEAFGNFEKQEQAVVNLERRLQAGKEKAETLTARLAQARQRVEARATAEAEWEARTSRRLRVLWGILGSIAVAMIISMLLLRLNPAPVTESLQSSIDSTSRSLFDAPIPDETKEAIITPIPARPSTHITWDPPYAQSTHADDDRLRVFDEL